MSGTNCQSENSAIRMDCSSQATADFCSFLDEVFDSINAQSFEEKAEKLLRKSVTCKSRHKIVWHKSVDVLKSMKFITKKKSDRVSPPVLQNFIFT